MKYLYLFFLLCLSFTVKAQHPLPEVREIGENEGLFLNDDISDVKVDSDGFVWIVSFSEIFRYDGYEFTEIEIGDVDHQSFIKFKESPTRKKYIVDIEGKVFFIHSDSLIAYELNRLLFEKNSYNKFVDIRFYSSERLIATPMNEGIITIEKDSLRQQEVPIGLNIILQNENLPLISVRNDYVLIDNKRFYKKSKNRKVTTFKLYDENLHLLDSIEAEGESNPFYRSLVKTKSGKILIAYNKPAIIEISNHQFTNSIPFEYPILNMFVDSQNGLWVSTKQGGVYYFKDSEIDLSKAKRYFPGTDYIISAQDVYGGIWGYSEKGKIFRIGDPAKVYYNEYSGFNEIERVNSIEKVDSLLYFDLQNNQLGVLNTITGSVNKVFLGSTKNQSVKFSGTLKDISDLSYDKKNKRLWISQRQQIRYYSEQEITNINHQKFYRPKAEQNFLVDELKNTGLSAAGVHNRQFFFCKDTAVSYVSQIFAEPLLGIIFLNDSIFINVKDGLYLYFNDKVSYLGEKYPLLNKRVATWTVWNNELWLSTRNSGVYILKEDSLERVNFNNYVLKSAHFLNQNDSILWLFSEIGSICMSKAAKHKRQESIYKSLPDAKLTDLKLEGNTVYAGTKNSGILTFDLEELKQQEVQTPTIYFRKLTIGNREIIPDSSNYNCTYDENSIKLFYSGISYEEQEVEFRYRMHGLREEWVNTNERDVQFANLTPGDYRFEIQARKKRQLWGKSKYIQFSIVPPIWQTKWFITLIIIGILFLIYLFINDRVQRMNREKSLKISQLKSEQRALRAKMDPHFMFNVISSLQFLVSNNMNEKAGKFLEQFSSLMRSTLDQTSLEFVSVEDEIKFLKEYIELERMRLEDRFEYEIKKSPSINEGSRIPNFLIQPFIENAIHHGLKNKEGKGFLQVSFEETGNGSVLKVTIEDNGVGFLTSRNTKQEKYQTRKSYGIKTVRERLKLINGQESVEIKDLSEEYSGKTGTRIIIYIKKKYLESTNR